MLSQPTLASVAQLLLAALATVAAISDLRSRRIPNGLVLAGVAVGFGFNLWAAGLPGLGTAAAGLGVGFALYFPLYLLRARGAGDVKLLAAVGSITGASNCVWIFMLTAILGGVIALILVASRGRLKKTMFNVLWISNDLVKLRAPYRSSEELDVTKNKGMRLPHAAMIFVGVAAFLAVLQWGLPAYFPSI